MSALFEIFTIGATVGILGYLFVLLWDSKKYGIVAKGIASFFVILTVGSLVVTIIEFLNR